MGKNWPRTNIELKKLKSNQFWKGIIVGEAWVMVVIVISMLLGVI